MEGTCLSSGACARPRRDWPGGTPSRPLARGHTTSHASVGSAPITQKLDHSVIPRKASQVGVSIPPTKQIDGGNVLPAQLAQILGARARPFPSPTTVFARIVSGPRTAGSMPPLHMRFYGMAWSPLCLSPPPPPPPPPRPDPPLDVGVSPHHPAGEGGIPHPYDLCGGA